MIISKTKSIKKNIYFYNLRDEDGELIKNQGLELNTKITETIFTDILKNDFYASSNGLVSIYIFLVNLYYNFFQLLYYF